MKKTLVLGLLFLVSGLVVGNNLYNKVNIDLLPTFKEKNNYYLLQVGVYQSKENMQKETRDILPKISVKKDGKYYVYVGLTTMKENSEKLQKIYKSQGINVYEKEIVLDNEELYSSVEQFDILIQNTSHEEEILTIEEVVLSSYEETLQKN